jgi:hypothetical protein
MFSFLLYEVVVLQIIYSIGFFGLFLSSHQIARSRHTSDYFRPSPLIRFHGFGALGFAGSRRG